MMGQTRSFLFLQGPPGPFFAELAKALTVRGHRCQRVNFNGGDRWNWHEAANDFRSRLDDWPTWLTQIMLKEKITDLLLFGDCRPLHRIACDYAGALGVRVHVFEEGYVRPDWITLERGGVNGFSRLPRNPATYLRLAEGLPAIPAYPPIPSSFWRRAREATTYYAGVLLLAPLYPHYRLHRPRSITAEYRGWLRKLAAAPLRRRRSRRTLASLGTAPYFILPLQLDADHQIRTHSPFTGMGAAIEAIIASFAAHAPQDKLLLVKEHPLDNGLTCWRRTVEAAAVRHGAGKRVRFVTHGHIDALVRGACGVVTVNSTTGTFALAAGVPVAVLGAAVYDLPGVTHQGSLNAFWRAPGKPQIEIYDAFLRVVVESCLIRGGFSSREGRAHLVPAVVERLTAHAGNTIQIAKERTSGGRR